MSDNIFALSSGLGRAGVAIIRLSGQTAFKCAEKFITKLPKDRTATVKKIMYEGELLDRGLIICFSSGQSFTGEEVVEFHLHGSVAVVKVMLEKLSLQEDCRIAKPGEFTRRALEAGSIDLTQAEGLGYLLSSETEIQRKQSLKILEGNLARLVKHWRDVLLEILAKVETSIEFAEEGIPTGIIQGCLGRLVLLKEDFSAQLSLSRRSEKIMSGFQVVLIGKPNIGKSTLLNYLANRNLAITSEIAGTTRDFIEAHINLDGFSVTVVDTAGIKEADNEIERIGIQRSLVRVEDADVRVFLLGEDDEISDFGVVFREQDIAVEGKKDIRSNLRFPGISGKTGDGVNHFLSLLKKKFSCEDTTAGLLVNQRHRNIMFNALRLLESSIEMLSNDEYYLELISEDIRLALVELDVLIGKVDIEDVLEEVFSRFCIGK